MVKSKVDRELYQVVVEVLEGRSLPGDDATNMSDPLVEIEVGPTSHRRRWTETKTQSVNAVWDQSFFFQDVLLSMDEFQREKVVFRVFNRNDFRQNNLLGSTEVSLSFVRRRDKFTMYKQWIALYNSKEPSIEKGYLLVTVSVIKAGDPPFQPSTKRLMESTIESHNNNINSEELTFKDPAIELRQAYFLNVLVYRAEDLNSSLPSSRMCNPFVSVRFNGNVLQTPVRYSQKNPSFNRLLQFPFYLPLMSDSIEVQLWNRIPFLPDTLLGTLSYFQSDLTHRPRGPLWENLEIQSPSGPGSVFSGRIILRLSVNPSRVPKPILRSSALDGISDEPLSEPYFLKVFLVRGSEMCVKGGYLSVTVNWGNRTFHSSKCLGSSGDFEWKQAVAECTMACPSDVNQVPNISLVLWHHSGLLSNRIGVIQLQARDLIFSGASYGINADHRTARDTYSRQISQIKISNNDTEQSIRTLNRSLCEHPKWRPIYGEDSAIGFLLASVVFGKGSRIVQGVPVDLPISEHSPARLQSYVSHAINLPSIGEGNVTNPIVVFRFMGHSCSTLPASDPSIFPIFNQVLTPIDVQFNSSEDPSLHILLFHEFSSGNRTLIARSAPMSLDVSNTPPVLKKVRLFRSNENFRSLEKTDSTFVYASVSLRDDGNTDKSIFHWLGNGNWETFQLRMFSIGLRNLLPFQYWSIARPALEVSFPRVSRSQGELPYIVETIKLLEKEARPTLTLESGSSNDLRLRDDGVHFLFSSVFPELFQLCVNVFEVGISGDTLIATRYISLKEIVSDEDLHTYISPIPQDVHQDEDVGQELEENEEHICLNLDVEMANFEVRPQISVLGALKSSGFPQKELENNSDNNAELKESVHPNELVRNFSLFRGNRLSFFGSKEFFNGKMQGSPSLIEVGSLKAILFAVHKNTLETGSPELYRLDEVESKISHVLDEYFVVRVYILRGWNIPTQEGAPYLGIKPRSRPYVSLKYGPSPEDIINDRDAEDVDEFNPSFYRMYQFEGNFPENSNLEISLWDKTFIGSDRYIGSISVDLEQRVYDSLAHGKPFAAFEEETQSLVNPTSSLPQGSLDFRIDVLNWKQAQEIAPDSMVKQSPEKYELRMVIWSTRDIRFPDEMRHTDGINQVITVLTNFSGNTGTDWEKTTDTAYSAGEDAAWNHRMVFPLKLPSRVPRVKITVWEDSLLFNREAIGDVQINLGPFFAQAFRERKSKHKLDRRWYSFTHPLIKDKEVGSINVEFSLVGNEEAERRPVGEAQSEPNRDPFLPPPNRNPPPWAIGSRFLNFLEDLSKKKFLIALVIFLIMGSVAAVWLVITIFGSGIA